MDYLGTEVQRRLDLKQGRPSVTQAQDRKAGTKLLEQEREDTTLCSRGWEDGKGECVLLT